MKKSLIATLVAVPVLALSSSAFAAEPLNAAQMDGVTAGIFYSFNDYAKVTQVNASPVTVTQVSVLNIGHGNGDNTAIIASGNTAIIHQ